MSSINETRPLPELIGGLANDISTLFRKEIQLAKAETSEKVSQVMGGVELLVSGAVLALGALGVLLTAAVAGLAALLVSWGMGEHGANSLASLIVGVIVAVIAFVLVNRGLKALKSNNLQLERTANSLGRDADMVKERL
jgi:high-affinity Fe2+/Pb2+ permease